MSAVGYFWAAPSRKRADSQLGAHFLILTASQVLARWALVDVLERAHSLGICAAFVAGDEVYGGRELRRGIRWRGMGYVMAVRANHTVTTGSGHRRRSGRHDSRPRLAPDAHRDPGPRAPGTTTGRCSR